jgi:hypothetical protein
VDAVAIVPASLSLVVRRLDMPFVSEKLIETTWKTIGAYNGSEMQKLQKRHQKSQKALIKTAYSFLDDLSEDASGVFLYIFHVVIEAFEKTVPKPKKITKPQIEYALSETELQTSKPTIDALVTSPEPHVLRYVWEALFEVDDVVISKSEIATIFALHSFFVECLHRACLKS